MIYKKVFKIVADNLSAYCSITKHRNLSLLTGITLMLAQSLFASAALSAVIYVGQGASGSNDGSSWTNAYTNLQTAITSSASGDEIWVKAGTYIPAVASNWTNAPLDTVYYHFHLKDGVALYGGFAGEETTLAERDISANQTVLSGNDSINSIFYHNSTVSPISVNNTAILDGFTLTGAKLKAMELTYSSATIRNCTFINNTGSAIFARPSSTHMYVENSTFINNVSAGTGAAIYINGYFNKNAYITNCTFEGNAAWGGGAIYNAYAAAVVTNSTFSGNTASSGNGHAILNQYMFYGDVPEPITNSILWNENSSGSEIYNIDSAVVDISYSIITGGYTGTENSEADPDFDPLGLQNNGGPVQTIAILDSGAAYDTATETGAPDSDARGISRPQGEAYDMGAFEIEVSTVGESSFFVLPLPNNKAVIFDL